MNEAEILNITARILENTHAGILATTGEDCKPHATWMSPAFLKGRPGVIFTVTSPHSKKIANLKKNPHVEWMFQNPGLDKIVNIRGRINILNNPSITREVMEYLGQNLNIFWKANREAMDYVVLETIIEEASYCCPTRGVKETVLFGRES